MQTKKFALAVIFLFFINLIFAQQSKIVGKVLSAKTGEVLIGATVSIEGIKKSVQTDQNGTFSIGGLSAGEYSLVCSYVSYASKTIANIKLKAGDVITQDVVLEMKSAEAEVVVKSSSSSLKPKETVNSLLLAQKNSASVSDGISAEVIKKTPDKNTSDVLKRISGTSIQDDKFVIIRGLNDRYNAAFINGAPLPSTEADRKAFSFDIFPANMLDNLIINKTATSDMTGEFAGGVIFVNTKEIVSKNFQSLSLGLGYNTISTFKNNKTYIGGAYDFLGMGDKARALPSNFPGMADYPRPASLNPKLGKNWKNDWFTYDVLASPNFSLQYANGRNFQRNGKDFFGSLFSVTYSRSNNISEGIRQLYQSESYEPGNNALDYFSKQTNYTRNVLLGAIGNLSLKINNNNSVSFKNLYSINSDDRVITRDGYNVNVYAQSEKNLWYTSNRILSSQLLGEHFIAKAKIKINWLLAYSDIKRNVPNLRTTIYTKADENARYEANIVETAEIGSGGSIYYANLLENSKNFKLDIQRSFKFGESFTTNLKIGTYIQTRDRDYEQRIFTMVKADRTLFNPELKYLPESQIYSKQNIGIKQGFMLEERLDFTNNYYAKTKLNAAYAMLDQRIGKALRLIYGVRFEEFNLNLILPIGVGSNAVVDRKVKDYLPSVNVIYSINKKQNFRLCYSRTLNRPEFRELCPGKFFDYSTRYLTNGDTLIQRATIDNFDLRYEVYPGKGQVLSVSGFYKKFISPIEQVTAPEKGDEASYFNVIKAETKGIEIEFRKIIGSFFNNISQKNFLQNLIFSTNLSIIKSSVTAKKKTDNSNLIEDRPLQGQSPYCFNGGLIYQNNDNGWSAALSANRAGDRLYGVGNIKNPSIWEKGRTVLDFQIGKSFESKNIEIKLNIKDILAQKLIFYEDANKDGKYKPSDDFIRWSRSFGQIFSFNVTYKF